MANKENITKLSDNNDLVPIVTGGGTALSSPNGNRKRPADLQSSSRVNDLPAKKHRMEAPSNVEQLRKFLADPQQMEQFSFQQTVDDWHGVFEIYSVDNVSYLAFHCNETVAKLPNDCRIFFYDSEELLKHFQRFTVQFEDVEDILMVFANHKTDRITPLGIFLLPNKSKPILDDVVKKIDEWLNGSPAVVTKCTTMYETDLQSSISKVWPSAKLIGCSDEYQKDVKAFAKRNKGHTDHHKDLTRLACVLCYVPQTYISTGINVIENRSTSEYGANLVRHLRTNWIGIRSVFGEENIIHRSVKVCKQFNKRMEEDYFESKYRYSSPKEPISHIIDFIGFLRTFSRRQVFEMQVDGSVYESRRNQRFQMNSKLQKETEFNILSSFNELNQSLEVLSKQNDEMAIQQAIEQFMLSIY